MCVGGGGGLTHLVSEERVGVECSGWIKRAV